MKRIAREYEPDEDAARDGCDTCWYYFGGVPRCCNESSEYYGDVECELCAQYTPTAQVED